MSLRKCEDDQSQAKYVCTTHDAYYCELHYRQHIADRKPHVSFPIDNALTQPEFEQLQNEVIERIKALEHAKSQVVSQAAQLIAKIRQACIASMENLDSLIQAYRAYAAENNFDDQTLQNITKMRTTRLQIEIDQDLTLNLREEPEEEKKSALMQPISESLKERETRNEPQAKQIPSIKYLENSLNDKISYCQQQNLKDFQWIVDKDKIKEIIFTNDETSAFVCKSYAGIHSTQTVNPKQVSIQ
jgi:hypothetical protein